MMKILSLITLIIISSGFLISSEITGKVLGKNDEPIIAASVALKSTLDSSVVSGSLTDQNGKFIINAKNGDYYLKVTYVGMKTKYIDSISLNEDRDLGRIILETGSVTSKEVVVQARKHYMELELDKRIINVDADPTNRGRNASEILDNIPSVQVDVEGQVSLRGSQNVRILVDGKPSGLVGRDPEQLRQLNGDMIEKVEVITSPNARYDAQGEAGIINLVLKKEEERGFRSNIDTRIGNPNNHGISLNSNYREGFYNLFSSVGVTYRRLPGFGRVEQNFYNSDLITYSESDRDQLRGGIGANFRIGSDFYLNEDNVLTTAFLYQFGDRNNEAEITYNDYLADNSLYQRTVRTDNEAEEKNDVEFELDYESKFDGKDHKLSFASKFVQDKDVEISDLTQRNLSGFEDDILQKSYNLEFERNILLQLDYVLPFSQKGKFETGAKSTMRKIDNDFKVEELQNREWVTSNFNDNFIYLENIYAAYMIVGEKFGNFSAQSGLRAEYSDIGTELTKSNYMNPREYLDFFPSLNFGYEFNEFNSFQLAYSRRIERPRFRFLMPFSNFTDPRNFWQGNPDLDPEYTHSYEATYLYEFALGSFLSSIYARNSTNIIQRVTRLDSAGFSTISPDNIGIRNSYGLEINWDRQLTDWFEFNANANFFRAITDGNESVNNLDADTYTWTGRITTKFKNIFGIDFQLNFNYKAPQEIPQGRMKQIWYLDLAANYDLSENASLTLSGRDVFSTRMRRMVQQDETFYFDQDFQWRGGVITLNFNYKIEAMNN